MVIGPVERGDGVIGSRVIMEGNVTIIIILSFAMSRQVSALARSSRRTPAARRRLGVDEELVLEDASRLRGPPSPGDSDWEAEVFAESSDDDSDYAPRPRDSDSSDEDEEVVREEPEVRLDYVRSGESSTETDDSENHPIADRIFRRANENAPGSLSFQWSSAPAVVRRFGFQGVYHSLVFY